MILTEKTLVNTLREHCAKAKRRIWIASPFIGEFKEVCKIIDGVWMNPSIEFKVLTDAEAGFIRETTLTEFQKTSNTEIRSLKSLHAKVYIVDDWCLLTSANLTGTAFSRRYEIGMAADIAELEKLYMRWWNKATSIDKIKKLNHGEHIQLFEYQTGRGLHFEKRCDLPPYSKTDKFMSDNEEFVRFAQLYESITGRNKHIKKMGLPLYMEVDYFFNYLYHDLADTPSKSSDKKTIRELTPSQREKEILKYFQQMPVYEESINRRLDRIQTIRNYLDPKNIQSLSKKRIEEILSMLYSVLPINQARILNNNKPSKIKAAWDKFLNAPIITSQSLQAVKEIYAFAYSGASELIACYRPDEYLIMNKPAKSGMRFFGIDIK